MVNAMVASSSPVGGSGTLQNILLKILVRWDMPQVMWNGITL